MSTFNYHGFGGSAGRPLDFMQWIMMGVAVLSVDCREQSGKTGNSAEYSNGHTSNVVCKGILDKNEYYFRAVYMDSLKAIDFACDQLIKGTYLCHAIDMSLNILV